jgi:hypothetical protein|tara:strand:+ start:54 stop:806 length:753 start_codon:yes stop_codon:yes gene_type:complete
MARKIIKKAVKEGIKRGRGRPKGSTNKTKTTKLKKGPIQSERSKIEAANKAAANKRTSKSIAKKALKATPATAAKKTSGRGNIRATALGLGASAAAVGTLNKKKPAPKETFAQAFKKARAKGEGTKFTHDGKQYTAVTKADLKKKGYDANELAAYNRRGGKARGPLNRLGQKAKKVLLGKDKKFGGDKGAIDFIRKPKKKAGGGMMKSKGMRSGGMMKSKGYRNGGAVNKRKATGAAKRGFGKAYMKGRR